MYFRKRRHKGVVVSVPGKHEYFVKFSKECDEHAIRRHCDNRWNSQHCVFKEEITEIEEPPHWLQIVRIGRLRSKEKPPEWLKTLPQSLPG